MKTYWISFAKYQNFLGCCIIDAEDESEALKKTKDLNINPGGEALMVEMPGNNEIVMEECLRFGKNVFISEEKLISKGYRKIKDFDEDAQNKIKHDPSVTIICEDCNENSEHID